MPKQKKIPKEQKNDRPVDESDTKKEDIEEEKEEEVEDEEEEEEEEEEKASEVSAIKPEATDDTKKMVLDKLEDPVVEGSDTTSEVDRLFEYKWPVDVSGEYYLLLDQVVEFLEEPLLLEKYSDLESHPVSEEEREYLQKQGATSDNNSSTELFALKTEDVCQLMIDHYPNKYQEYIQIAHMKEKQMLLKKAEEDKKALNNRKIASYIKRALKDVTEFNSQLAQQRKEERCSYFDMQTQIIHVPMNKRGRLPKHATKPSLHPVALLPGQFQEYYKSYTPTELSCLPLNTVLEIPKPRPAPEPYIPPPKPASETCEVISQQELVEHQSSDEDVLEPPTKKVPGKYKPPKRSNAMCGICLKGPESNKKAEPEELIHCSQCENSGHPSCLDMSAQLVKVIQTYPWQCMECKTCIVCRDPFDEDKMLFCDECDRGFHSFCVGLKEIPGGRWICDMCAQCACCLRKTSGDGPNARWQHEYSTPRDGEEARFLLTLCMDCSRLFRSGNCCPVCLKVYRNDESDLPMVCCDECDRWIHTDCDGIDEGAYKKLAKTKTKYKCVLCRGDKTERMDSFHKKYRTQNK